MEGVSFAHLSLFYGPSLSYSFFPLFLSLSLTHTQSLSLSLSLYLSIYLHLSPPPLNPSHNIYVHVHIIFLNKNLFNMIYRHGYIHKFPLAPFRVD